MEPQRQKDVPFLTFALTTSTPAGKRTYLTLTTSVKMFGAVRGFRFGQNSKDRLDVLLASVSVWPLHNCAAWLVAKSGYLGVALLCLSCVV